MVFSSIPVYLDPPNWPQPQQQGHQGGNSEIPNNIPLVATQPPPPPGGGGGVGGGGGPVGSIRPGSMADRARLAKIPQPEAGLKCPRCESTNTKFCYFNNYSLTQPRHFCKTCRRYWTRGGALRNVPVGGGCRRNKRSKRSRSKSPIMASDRHATASTSNSAGVSSTTPAASDIISHLPTPASQLPFLPPLHNLHDYISRDVGLNFSRIGGSQLATMVARGGHGNNNNTSDMEFQIGGNTTGLNGQMLPNGGFLHQFPFFSNIVPSQPIPPPPAQAAAGLYPMEGEGTEPPSGSMNGAVHQLFTKQLDSRETQMGSNAVKMEEAQGLNNLSRNLNFSSALSSGSDHQTQFWSVNAWTDLSGFSSSTSNNML